MRIRHLLVTRAMVVGLVTSLCIGLSPVRVMGSTSPTGTQSQASNPSVPAQAPPTQQKQGPFVGRVSPVTDPRVGVDNQRIIHLSLHDAILKALENNNEIQVQRTNVQISEYALKALDGYYDVVLGSNLTISSNTRPSANRITAGSSGSVATTSDSYTMNYNFSQQMPIGGGNWHLAFNNSRISTNQFGSSLNPFYNSNIALDFQQPLFRNFRNDQTRNQIRIAKKALDLSDSQFRQRVVEIIAQVQKAYWDLVFAIRNVEIMKESMQLAKVNLENNRKQVEVGTLAPIDLAQSQAEVERRHQDEITSIGSVTVAENIVKGLILGDPSSPEWRGNLAPTESIEILPPAIDYESAQRLAFANRTELEQLRLQKEQNELDLKYFRNQTLPQIDFVGRYATAGLAGRPGPPIDFGGLPGFGGEVPALFVGGLGRAFNTAIQNRFREVVVGVQINFPLLNRTAKANLGRSKARGRVLQFQEKQLQQLVLAEVRNALQGVETARQTIEAARAARAAREVQLAGEQKKFEAGLSTTFLVLTFQNQLSLAKGAELQALVNYNKAIAEIQRVLSTTLDANNVQVTPAQGSDPATRRSQPKN